MTSDVTSLLHRHRDGDDGALHDLMALVYDELHGLARHAFAGEMRRRHTLQPTALVHEAWLKLGGSLDDVETRRHFFALAAKAMRQVLADHARARGRLKRNLARRPVSLDASTDVAYEADDLVALDDSLAKLAGLNERHARIVELRIFGSLTVPEVAVELGVSRSTIESDWTMARTWLRRELGA